MKKIIISIIIVLIILLIGTPYLFGIKAEKNYFQFLQQIQESGTFKVQDSIYQRGFFSSTANTTLSIVNSSKKIRLIISDKIYHGPFNFYKVIKGNMDLNPILAITKSDIKAEIPIKTSDGDEKTISINMSGNTKINIDQIVKSKIIIPKYKIIKSKDKIIVNLSGLELDLDYNIKTKYLSSSMFSKLLSIEDKDTKLTFNNINGISNAVDHDGNLSSTTGEYEIKIDNIVYSSTYDSIQMHNIKFSGYSKKDQEKLNSGFKIVTDEININKDKFGPFVTEINLKNIDYKAYYKLQSSAQAINSNNIEKSSSIELMDILPELLKYSPSLEITNLNLDSDKGNLKAQAKMKIKGDNPQLLQNVLLIGNAIEADADATISKNLINYFNNRNFHKQDFQENDSANDDKIDQSTNLKIQELLDNNIITSDSKNFIFKAQLKNGNLTVNNKPLAIHPMLLNMN